MKKFCFAYLLGLTLLQVACKKESFDYEQAEVGADRIDTLIFNPSHYILNADGISTLSLKLSPSYWGNDEKTYTGAIALSRFKPSDYAYYYEEECGREVQLESADLTFPPDTPSKKIKVFARMFGVETRKLEVELRPGWGEGVKEKVIPVVFHIFQYTGTKNTDFVIESIHIDEKMRKLNNAFSRLISTGAVSTDTKIRFQLAGHNQYGRTMAKPGINEINFGFEKLNPEELESYYDRDAQFDWQAFLAAYEVDWNPTEFLNIWVLPVGDVEIPSFVPAVIKQGSEALKGLKMAEVESGYVPLISECGIVINYGAFVGTELNAIIGQFLGLLPTNDAKVMDGDSDYCDDTFLYSVKEETKEVKFGINKPITFHSDNIMDGKSQSIAVTNEQAKRMHYILENVPSRRMWRVVE